MSESPRARRTRLKTLHPKGGLSEAQGKLKSDSPHLPPSRSQLDSHKATRTVRPHTRSPASAALNGSKRGPKPQKRASPDMMSETHTVMAEARPSDHKPLAAVSDGGSSSLSDLEEIPEDRQETETRDASDNDSMKENDTEAETERIDPSPRKSRKLAAEAAGKEEFDFKSDAVDSSARIEEAIEPPEMESLSPVLTADAIAVGNDEPAIGDFEDLEGTLARENQSPRKRKRSSPLSELDDKDFQDSQPVRKRSASARLAVANVSAASQTSKTNNVTEEQEDVTMRDSSELSAEEDGVAKVKDDIDATIVEEDNRRAAGDEPDSPRSSGEADEATKTLEEAEEEPVPEPGGDLDEAEAAAKSEEELARKRLAMDDLKPIENRFAIFRDRLFDERLKELSKILEDLHQPEPTNATYQAQKRCVDARRDEKIRLENVTLRYKAEALERVTLAERSIKHSQFAQEVRERRDDHHSRLNRDFSRIQRERRQWKAQESHYIYDFKPERQEQILNQRSYNKEVSLLSGIARHSGFPAAPDLDGAGKSDVGDDLIRMQIKPQAASYVAQIANSNHNQEMAGEANFLEKNTWARNPAPSVPLALLRERTVGSPFAAEPTNATPQRNFQEVEHSMNASGSTIGLASDPRVPQQATRSSPFSDEPRRAVYDKTSTGQDVTGTDRLGLSTTNQEACARRPSPLGKLESGYRKVFGSSPSQTTNSAFQSNHSQSAQMFTTFNDRHQGVEHAGHRNGYTPAKAQLPRSSRFSLPPAPQVERPLFGPIQNGITTEPAGQR